MGRTMSRPRTPQPAGRRQSGWPLWIEWTLATRFLREGKTQSTLILVGIAVGVAVLVFLTALITGLQNNIIDRTGHAKYRSDVPLQEQFLRMHAHAAGNDHIGTLLT